ncbi:cellulase family glycosylhydrolase [Saccharopolyspora spinosporotrichia]
MRRNSAKVRVDGEPAVWLGANFWSRTGGPLMWRNYDPVVVRSELEVLVENGLRQTRSFFYWPDFMPAPDRIDEEKAAHFADFLDAHTETGMTSIPTFIVGHMSGDNWDPAWRGGRDLYADVWLVARQAWFVERMSERFAEHPAVAGWLISNEMPIYGRLRHEPVAPAEHVLSWAQLMVQAVRAGGARQPVSLGDGAWGIEVTGVDNGFSVRDTGALVDFVGPHVYRMDSDPVRHHLNAAFVCELSAVAGKPVVLEEFGLSSDHVSAQNAGHYYRQTLHTSLLAGATGWLAWNNTDYDGLVAQEPYSHHPFEMHFGITDHTGTPKTPLLELDSFARTLDAVDFPRCSRTDTDVALLVSEYLEHGYPYAQADDRPLIFTTLRQGYVAAREADLPVGFVRERDGVEDCALYLLPCVKQIQGPTWLALRERVAAGSVLYLSYCAGEVEHHRERGCPTWTRPSASRSSSPTGWWTPSRTSTSSSPSPRTSAGSRPVRCCGSGSAATSTAAPSSRWCRTGRRSSRQTPTAVPRCCATRPVTGRRCSAPIRWSTSRRATRGSIPSPRTGSTRRWPPSRGAATGRGGPAGCPRRRPRARGRSPLRVAGRAERRTGRGDTARRRLAARPDHRRRSARDRAAALRRAGARTATVPRASLKDVVDRGRRRDHARHAGHTRGVQRPLAVPRDHDRTAVGGQLDRHAVQVVRDRNRVANPIAFRCAGIRQQPGEGDSTGHASGSCPRGRDSGWRSQISFVVACVRRFARQLRIGFVLVLRRTSHQMAAAHNVNAHTVIA